MKKILQIVSSLKKNGTETFIMNLYRHIDKQQYQFDFLTFSNDKEGYYDEIISLGGAIFFCPPRKKGMREYHKNLNSFFKHHSKEYDAVHLHGMSHTTIAPLYYAKKHGISIRISHIHGANCEGFHNKLFHYLNKKRLNSIATHFLSCSEAALKWGYKSTGAFEKARIITNGINLHRFSFNETFRKDIRKDLGFDKDFVLIHIGSFNSIKNHAFLLEVVSKLTKIIPNIKLLCVGEGTLLSDMKIKASNLGISEKVYFLGRRDDTPQLLSGADLMIMPSLHEGLGIVLIEAQATGLPVLASDTIPPESKCSDDYTFLSLSSGPCVWAEKIKEFIYSSPIRHPRLNDMNNFSIESTLESICEIYGS